ncbi:hypothetical protein CBA19CS91_26500 [Paraburkholderia hospita]|nr:hypothetical protein CBA19CS91_26500 [Paraburkholderia hospita]
MSEAFAHQSAIVVLDDDTATPAGDELISLQLTY